RSHRYPAAKFDIVLGILGVEHGHADARVAEHIPVLDAPRDGREEQVIAVTADPHRRRLRTAVRVDRGENRVVPAVEQLERRVTERDSHARKVAGAGQQSAESYKAGKRAGPWRTDLSSRSSGPGAKRRRSREFWQDSVGVVDPRAQQR